MGKTLDFIVLSIFAFFTAAYFGCARVADTPQKIHNKQAQVENYEEPDRVYSKETIKGDALYSRLEADLTGDGKNEIVELIGKRYSKNGYNCVKGNFRINDSSGKIIPIFLPMPPCGCLDGNYGGPFSSLIAGDFDDDTTDTELMVAHAKDSCYASIFKYNKLKKGFELLENPDDSDGRF